MWIPSLWGFSEMTIQPARHQCHTCCPLQAEKTGIQPVVGNTHDTHVEQVVSSFQENPQGLGTHMVHSIWIRESLIFSEFSLNLWTYSNLECMKVWQEKTVIWLFLKILVWITISMESSQRDLFIDVVVDRFILKNNQITLSLCFTLWCGITLNSISFYCVSKDRHTESLRTGSGGCRLLCPSALLMSYSIA